MSDHDRKQFLWMIFLIGLVMLALAVRPPVPHVCTRPILIGPFRPAVKASSALRVGAGVLVGATDGE